MPCSKRFHSVYERGRSRVFIHLLFSLLTFSLGQKEEEEPKVTFCLVLFQVVESGRVWAVHLGHVSLDDRNSPKGPTSATMLTAHALGTPQQPPAQSP